MIRHTVVFKLRHAEGSKQEQAFLDDSMVLASLPTVKNFERLRQISAKNSFKFGFSMEFDDQASYDAYNIHPTHVSYVRDRWMKEVADFMEIDYVKV
jgi:hypothetical protein